MLFAMAVKACAFCFAAGACVASCNADFLCVAFAVFVKITVGGMAFYICVLRSLAYGICHAAAPLLEALAACLVWARSVLAADFNI